MRGWLGVVGMVALTYVGSPAVGRAAEQGPEGEIGRLEMQRFEAMKAADVATLDRILSPDLTYTHSTAKVETKKEFIEGVKAGTLKYKVIAPDDTRVRVYGSTAVGTGRCRFEVESAGQELKVSVRFTDVYVKRDGAWQLVAWQSTRIPEP
jgi:hypothetical protein